MEIKKKLILRNVAGDNILVPIGTAVNDFNGVFTVSPSAAVAFRAIEDGEDEDGILSRVLEEFDVEKETAEADIADFLARLREFGII